MASIFQLQKIKDGEIRELGYEKLYSKNRLSKPNIECFVDGFKAAICLSKTDNVEEFLKNITTDIEMFVKNIEDGAGYSGRYLTDKECGDIMKLKLLIKLIKDLK